MTYIKPFSELTRADSATYGGKAASLGDMLQASIPVPDGFGVSIEAHRTFADTPFSEEFKAELHQAFRSLGGGRVAVRSSAVAEDAADASWAGQLETYLNVTEAELESKVRECWQSVEADHVKEYAQGKTLSRDSLLVGVAVQVMVESELAGVMFTVNPVSRDPNELVIEGAYGLGETVVQGIVTPDNFLIDKRQLQVTQFNIQVKEQMMVFKDGENRIISVPDAIADRAILREEQVLELARLGLRIEEYFGAPHDIEWAYAAKAFYIVQARPITTL